jgi:uncharacterized membrane protein
LFEARAPTHGPQAKGHFTAKRRGPYLFLSTASDAMSEQTYFDAVLHPNRSLAGRGFVLLMVALAALSFIGGIVIISVGAWPVFGFLGLDVLLIYVAFRASYRSGRLVETVRLTDAALEVRRIDAYGRAAAWRVPPTWAKVEVDNPGEHDCRVILRSHGESLVLGAFLSPPERKELAEALRAALRRQRNHA